MIYLAAIGYVLTVVFVGAAMLLSLDRTLKAWAVEREEWGRERAMLLQRIQAPQHAVTQHYNKGVDVVNPPAVRSDDDADEDFWQAHESREELAERLMAEEQRG